MKILMTGAGGFLGGALTRFWYAKGHSVAVLARPESNLSRIADIQERLHIRRYASDSDLTQLVAQFAPDVVVHTACVYGREGESPLSILDGNVRLGIVLMQALSRLATPARFINCSSSLPPVVSLYALSKANFSQWGRFLAGQSNAGIRFLDLKLHHMFGPNDDATKFVTYVLRSCQNQVVELKLTAGEQLRDFIYIDDVVSAFDTILQYPPCLELSMDLEIGSGCAVSVRSVVETIHAMTASKTKLLFGAKPYREGELMFDQADITILRDMGWRPTYSLHTGVEKMIEQERIK